MLRNNTRSIHVPAFMLVFSVCLLGCLNIQAADPLDREFEFASGLVGIGFSDFAENVVNQILRAHPDQKDRAKLIQAEILISRRKFEEAKALVDSMPPDSAKAQAITLALANAYYRRNNFDEARAVYDEFFKQYKGRVPADPDLRRFYQEAAYKFGQMLETAGDISGAINAYNRVLQTKPGGKAERKLKAEQARLYIDFAKKEDDDRWLDEADKLCNEIQWGGLDIFFGQSLITMARAELARGDKEAATRILKSNMDILDQIDEVLKDNEEFRRENPMAGARFMLGMLHKEEGEALAKKKDQREDAVKRLGKALGEFYNVFVKYGDSIWGSKAGILAKEIKERLETDFGKTVRIDLGEQKDRAAKTQFKLANNLFGQEQYEQALDEYLKVLNHFPESSMVPGGLGNLAICYGQQKNDLYVKMVCEYAGERFDSNNEAAMALLRVGKWFFDQEDKDMYLYVYETYLRCFPEHGRAPAILYTLASLAGKDGNKAAATEYFERIVENYPDDQYYLKALNRIAWNYYGEKEYKKAATAFQRFIAAEQPGHERARAQFCMADSYKQSEDYRKALLSYAQLLKWLEPEDNAYSISAKDVEKNKSLQEKATFNMGYCYARMNKPAASVPNFREKGISFYRLFIKKYPQSELAPPAMNGMGTLQLGLKDYDAAVATFNKLADMYPDSVEGKNAVFSLIRSAMEVENLEVARDGLDKMLDNASTYDPGEFSRVGQLMLDAGLYSESVRAFRQVRNTGKERAQLERALFGLGLACFEMENYNEAVKHLEELLERYPKSGLFYEAKFLLGRAYRQTERLEEAMLAISDVSKYAEGVVTINKASHLLGQIQKAQGDLMAALASFQRVALLADPENPELRPLVEECILGSIAMSMELGRYTDVQDSCDQYLKIFHDSDKIPDVRKTKADAKMKASQAAAERIVKEAEAEAEKAGQQ